MSIISERHQFVEYVAAGSQKTTAFTNQRLSVVRFKAGKDGKKLRNTQAVSVPLMQLTPDDTQDLAVHINSWFAGVQDEIIREKCIAGSDCVTTEELTVSAVKQYLVSQAAGERLTGDVIRSWFATELADLLLVAFAEKLQLPDSPSEEQVTKLQQMVNVYQDKFASMAGGRTMFDAATRAKLTRALELSDCAEGTGQKLHAKLQSMQKVNVEELLGL